MARIKLTVYVEEDVAQKMRGAVAYLAGHPLHLTMAKLAETALVREIERLQGEYHHGKPFPKFKGRRQAGRPVGT